MCKFIIIYTKKYVFNIKRYYLFAYLSQRDYPSRFEVAAGCSAFLRVEGHKLSLNVEGIRRWGLWIHII